MNDFNVGAMSHNKFFFHYQYTVAIVFHSTIDKLDTCYLPHCQLK